MSLDAASIIAEAEERVGITDTDTFVHGNLECLIEALRDAKLSDAGAARARRNFVSDTVSRLEGLRWLRDFPEIAAEQIAAPVFLMGLPRSGTTYLQYLFDRDPRFRLIRTWEAITPSPPPGFDPASAQRRKAEWAALRRREHPSFEGFDALHLIDEDGSDECHAFLQQSYGAVGLHNLFHVPSFFEAVLDRFDLAATYRVHKRQLQMLQWRAPARPWALKYPSHIVAMNEILEVYPDARFVMTHRDPVQTLASISKMTLNLRGTRSDVVDPRVVGADMLHFIARHIERIIAFDRGPHGGRVVHVDYYALVDDPVRMMADIHRRLGIDTPDYVRDNVVAWRRDNPKNARGANEYKLEQYGLDHRAAAERFAGYTARFGIPKEDEGLARFT